MASSRTATAPSARSPAATARRGLGERGAHVSSVVVLILGGASCVPPIVAGHGGGTIVPRIPSSSPRDRPPHRCGLAQALPRGETSSDMARNRASASSPAAATSPVSTASSRASSYRATELGYEVFGIRRGWEGLTHQTPGSGAGRALHHPARPDQHAHHRPDRRHLAAHLAHQPAQDEGRQSLPPHLEPSRPSR